MALRLPMVIAVLILGYLPALTYSIHYRKEKNPLLHKIALWGIPSLFIGYYFIVLILLKGIDSPALIHATEWVNLLYFMIFVPCATYILFYGIHKLCQKIFKTDHNMMLYLGFCLSVFMFTTFIIGATQKYDFMVREVKFDLPTLPASYNGMKIAVISDVHLGNFTGAHSFLDSVKHVINSNQVEIICLTGDLLNMVGREGEEYFPYFIDMNAKIGKYAIMGNHDYGDYSSWPSSDAKYENLLLAHSTYRHLGFDLLLDEFRILRNSEDSISIIGVENWSKPPFPQYGSFEKATENIPVLPFNILLTHDPNHWEYEIMGKQKIDLTLSGHTHGAQIAFNRCGIKWSPASVLFKNWDGVYQHNNQFLFVNQGLGYVGLPYRLGTPPEITIITLNHSETFGYDINVSRSHLWSRDKVIYSCN